MEISAIPYNEEDNTAFEGSYMESWLNDTTVDGFLGNLRNYENYIVSDATWDATLDATSLGSIERPNGTITVTDAVGLLNMYEYQSSNNGGTDGYLNNGLNWWTLTPYDSSNVRCILLSDINKKSLFGSGVRPSINLKSNVKIVDGNGTIDNPYKLEGDNDTNLSGTLLNTRYSGEYIRFGNEDNNLYRIVSHENGIGTKITSAEPLKENGTIKRLVFDNSGNLNYSSTNTIGLFLNGEYLTNYVGAEYSNMIEDNTTWYIGNVNEGESYMLAKYTDTSGNTIIPNTTQAKVGLLRMGELMAGQFNRSANNTIHGTYYTLTTQIGIFKYLIHILYTGAYEGVRPIMENSIKPSLNLKQNVIITSGDGTKNNPFTIKLAN